METYASALAKILAHVPPGPKEWVDADALTDRVLAEPVTASFDLPPFDNSSVDGYGVRAEEVQAGTPLRVAGELAAGTLAEHVPIGPGEAVRLFTGSPVPPGVDAVVMQEEARREGDHVWIASSVAPGENVRRRGAELAAGDPVVPAGIRVTPPVRSLLATLGQTGASVFRRPTIALLGSGNELVPPGAPRAPHQLFESISPGLRALLEMCGAEVVSSEVTPDDPGALDAAVERALKAEMVVSFGGVSVGDYDFIRAAYARAGVAEVFWRIAIRPGKPFFFGRGSQGQWIFGLPGNPVSALVTGLLLVRPALCQRTGQPIPALAPIRLGEAWPKVGDRDDFVRARLVDGTAFPTAAQGSHMLSGLAQADVLLRLPAGSGPYRVGDVVEGLGLPW